MKQQIWIGITHHINLNVEQMSIHTTTLESLLKAVKLLKAGYSSNSCPVFFSSRVVYRYSLLNQNDADRYDNEFETAISAASGTVYHDSDDDEVRQLLS